MATYKTGWMKKLINGVSTRVFAIAHAKSTYFNYSNNRTVYDELESKAPKANPSFTGNLLHGSNNSTEYANSNSAAIAGNNLIKVKKNQFATGHYQDYVSAMECPDEGTNNYGSLFVIGNGRSGGMNYISNAFRVTAEGEVRGKKAYNASGADYAEFFEWADGNEDSEDRRGFFVTFDEEKPHMIRKAKDGDYILGVVSGNPCIIGNSDEDWRGRYIFDDFGDFIYENTEVEREYEDPETGEKKTEKVTVTDYKRNPDYDPSIKYTPRKYRKEWDCVGMIGVLSTIDDGTCVAGGYCKCNNEGIATKAQERGMDTYRVLERVTDNIVKVCIK